MEFKTLHDFVEWLHQQRNAKIEFPTHGNVRFHVYGNALVGGGVQASLWLGPGDKEADMEFLEEKPGVLTVAVVPNGECSIDWTHKNKKRFAPDAPLEALLEAFPDGRNIGAIVEALKTLNG